jgi:serine/threonine-protein kinase
LLNRPLFPGGGQLAILLAIRDCKVDALQEIRGRLPPGLFEVLQRALSRSPESRYPSATDFAQALAPFEADPRLAVREIAARVRWVQAASSSDSMAAVRESARAIRVARESTGAPKPVVSRPAPGKAPSVPVKRAAVVSELPNELESDAPEHKTSEYELLPTFVVKASGEKLGPWTFARLMEALATGTLTRGDRVDFVGRGLRDVEDIEEFARFFSPPSATTGKLDGPGAPDFKDDLSNVSMLQTLMRVFQQRETGVLFAERPEESPQSGGGAHKELYFVAGKLHHVASSNASELLGEYLVRRGKLEREELDLALAVLPRYGGRMGDTLISMGLVGPVDIFRAIREQGRDRVADLFLWRSGLVTFYRGQTSPPVEFPLDLDLPGLMLAGLEVAKPGESPLEGARGDLDRVLTKQAKSDDLFTLDGVVWPQTVSRVQSLVTTPMTLRDVVKGSRAAGLESGDVLRAVEILLAAGLVKWRA